MVHFYAKLVNTMNKLVNWTGEFHLENEINFVNGPITRIVNDTLSSEYILKTMITTHVWFMRLPKLCVYDGALLHPLKSLGTKRGTGTNLSKSHHDCSVLNSTEPREVKMMVSLADYFMKRTQRTPRSILHCFIQPQNLRLQSCDTWTRGMLPGSFLHVVLHFSKVEGAGRLSDG